MAVSAQSAYETAARPMTRHRPWLARAAAWLWEKFWALATLAFVVFPIAWLVFTAFRVERDVYSTRFFTPLTLANIQKVFAPPYSVGAQFMTSLLISTLTVVIAIPLALMASYVFARYRFRGSRALLVGVLITQFIPPLVVAIPLFNLYRKIGINDTPLALIIVYMSIVVPYAIWMLRGFIEALPIEIEEAAIVDGCNPFQVLLHVTFPLVLPGIITSMVFSFIMCWNEFTYALILAGHETTTLQIGLSRTIGLLGVAWELMSAIGLLVMIPMFILSFTIRRYFVEGLTMGAVK